MRQNHQQKRERFIQRNFVVMMKLILKLPMKQQQSIIGTNIQKIYNLISNSYLNLSLSRTDPRHVLGDIVYYYKDSEYVEDLISEIITTEEKITSIVQDWNTCEKFVRYKLFDTDDIFTEDQFISANEYYSGCAKIYIEEWLGLKTNFLKLGGKK